MDPSSIAERAVVCAVTVPGETRWAQRLVSGAAAPRATSLDDAVAGLALDAPATKLRTPVPEQPSVTALVKMYDMDQAEQVKTAEIIDVVGVLDQCVYVT